MENVNKQLLERWAAFGKAMQKAGSELPRHLIADTEQAIAAAEQAQQAEPVALDNAELLTKWDEAYRAFIGAFDTPLARRRMGDDYSTDARDRLFHFDRAFRNAAAQPPAQQQAEPVAAQCRFEGEEWKYCTIAHHLLVQAHPKEWPHYETRALCLANDAAESVICTTGHNTEGRQWVLYKEQIAADHYLEDCIAHLEWRGIARRLDAEDGVTVIFKEKP